MNFISFLFAISSLLPAKGWETDFEKAKQIAADQHKLILLNFSGSDWCGPCIRLHNEIFDSNAFTGFADSSLILLNADFPRLKKNQLLKEQQQKNEQLADTYNPKGNFPYTVLLDASGKVIQTWNGYPKLGPEQFVHEIKALSDAGK
jgi:thioredoxin-related protein